MGSPKTLTREELYDLVWSKPMSQLAPEFGLSDQGLAKKCKKHHIPRPSVGYWAKLTHGKAIGKTTLPGNEDPNLDQIEFSQAYEDKQSVSRLESESVDERLSCAMDFTIPEHITRYHPAIRTYRKSYRKKSTDRYGRADAGSISGNISIKVTAEAYDRACRFMHGLLNLFEECGWAIAASEDRYGRPTTPKLVMGEDEIGFELIEKIKRVLHVKTDKEKSDQYYWGPKYDYLPQGILELRITNYFSLSFKKTWRDKKKQTLEQQLVSIVQGFDRAFECARVDRLERDRQHKAWEEEARRQRELQRLEEIEQVRRDHLFKLAESYQRAQTIRAFLASLEASSDCKPDFTDWLKWANGVVDAIDPTGRAEEIVSRHSRLAKTTDYFDA